MITLELINNNIYIIRIIEFMQQNDTFYFTSKIRSNVQIIIRIWSLLNKLIITQISMLKIVYIRIVRKGKKLRIRF